MIKDPETNKTVRDSKCWRGTANFSTASSIAFDLNGMYGMLEIKKKFLYSF